MKKKKYFITDLGKDIQLKEDSTGRTMSINRYGVWKEIKNKAELIETSSNISYLKNKYKTNIILKI